jgi:hypothetical protein
MIYIYIAGYVYVSVSVYSMYVCFGKVKPKIKGSSGCLLWVRTACKTSMVAQAANDIQRFKLIGTAAKHTCKRTRIKEHLSSDFSLREHVDIIEHCVGVRTACPHVPWMLIDAQRERERERERERDREIESEREREKKTPQFKLSHSTLSKSFSQANKCCTFGQPTICINSSNISTQASVPLQAVPTGMPFVRAIFLIVDSNLARTVADNRPMVPLINRCIDSRCS